MNNLLAAIVADWSLVAWFVGLASTIAVLVMAYRERRPRQRLKAPLVLPAPTTKPSAMKPVAKPVEMLERKYIAAEYERRKRSYEVNLQRVQDRIFQLDARRLETALPEDVLASASPQELESLAVVLGLASTASAAEVVRSLRAAGSNDTAVQIRKMKGDEPFVSYREVVSDAAKKTKAKIASTDNTAAERERAIVVAVFNTMLDKATPEQRAALIRELSKREHKLAQGVGVAASGLVIANLSGFGLYVAASSALAALTGALGITLPFAAYTGLSSVIATVIGPVGWVVLIIGGVAMIGGVNYKKTVPAVLAIAAVRARLIAERDHEIGELVAEQKGHLTDVAAHLQALRALLDRMAAGGIDKVPKGDVPL